MLNTVVAANVLRGVIRPFLRHPKVRFCAVLVVPDAEDLAVWERGALSLLVGETDFSRYADEEASVKTIDDHSNASDVKSARVQAQYTKRTVVLVHDLNGLDSGLRTAADLITEIPKPQIQHFLSAARELRMSGMTHPNAELLASVNLWRIGLAFRKGRPLNNAIRRLKRELLDDTRKNEPAAPSKSVVRLEELSGYGVAKEWGLRLARDFREWKDGEIRWEDMDRGALLSGPPGCGKTMYASALAASCGVELIATSAAKWQAKGHLGDYLKAMRAAFDEARKKAPCILFIDEFDSAGDRERNVGSDNADYKRQSVNGLLECLDGVDGREGVVVIGATNHPSQIDAALLRPGRLDFHIEIPLPDDGARLDILRHHLGGQVPEGDLSPFIKATRGLTGAVIEQLARNSRRRARDHARDVALEDILSGLPTRRLFSTAELHRIAVHEAGHALASIVLETDEVIRAFVDTGYFEVGGLQHAGGVEIRETRVAIQTKETLENRMAVTLAGIAAERVVFGNHASGAGGAASSDLAVATDIATRMESNFGFGDSLVVSLGSPQNSLETLRERNPDLMAAVDRRMKVQLERMMVIISDRRDVLDGIVLKLLNGHSVSGSEILEIVARGTDALI